MKIEKTSAINRQRNLLKNMLLYSIFKLNKVIDQTLKSTGGIQIHMHQALQNYIPVIIIIVNHYKEKSKEKKNFVHAQWINTRRTNPQDQNRDHHLNQQFYALQKNSSVFWFQAGQIANFGLILTFLNSSGRFVSSIRQILIFK